MKKNYVLFSQYVKERMRTLTNRTTVYALRLFRLREWFKIDNISRVPYFQVSPVLTMNSQAGNCKNHLIFIGLSPFGPDYFLAFALFFTQLFY